MNSRSIFWRIPPSRLIASSIFCDFSDSDICPSRSITFDEVALSTSSYSRTRGSISSAVRLYHLRMSPSSDLTRESATYH